MSKRIVSFRDRKWIFYTGILLWCLTIPAAFNTIVAFIVGLRILYLPHTLITFLLLIMPPLLLIGILERVKKPEARIRSLIHILLLATVFIIAWMFNITYSLIEASELINILFFTLIFSTAFTVTAVPLSLHLYSRKNKAITYNIE